MKRFQNILFVSRGVEDETESLKQALSLASNNKAALKILVIYPQLPGELGEYRQQWEAHLEQNLQETVRSTYATLNRGALDIQLSVTIEGTSIPEVQIIRQVLRNGHDLVIKSAETITRGKGFKALDMELLRKCPCPLWLARPIAHSRDRIRVAVAIDPEDSEQTANDLSMNLLALAASLASSCSGELDIVSCWECEYEDFLRNNPFTSIPENQVSQAVAGTQQRHRHALDILASKTNPDIKTRIHHLRGKPETIIPDFVERESIDILVMGTVARTGIPGFIMGNTAENLVQELTCSLLALKPGGFVSPITAY